LEASQFFSVLSIQIGLLYYRTAILETRVNFIWNISLHSEFRSLSGRHVW